MSKSLRVQQLTKRYGQGKAVIQDLQHEFEAGTATGLVGPNGSGKTTLLRILCVESYPTEGSVHYGDLNVHEKPHAYLAHAGIVHAESSLPSYLSAVELLEWILRARNSWDEHGQQRISEILDALLLDERRENLIGTYSSGMVQKTQIAAALVHKPAVLLMDEPFRSLDEATTERTLSLLQDRKEAGAVLVIASHLDESLRTLTDDILQMGKPATAA